MTGYTYISHKEFQELEKPKKKRKKKEPVIIVDETTINWFFTLK
jgi:hypothetical protein